MRKTLTVHELNFKKSEGRMTLGEPDDLQVETECINVPPKGCIVRTILLRDNGQVSTDMIFVEGVCWHGRHGFVLSDTFE